MIFIFLLPFIAQALLMFVDEVFFHQQRGLPLWEKIGHPVDTASVILCYALAMGLPMAESGILYYFIAAGFSCVLISKDEWVHSRECQPLEQWLHSLLFVLHPIVLMNIFILGYLKTWGPEQQPLLILENFRQLVFLLPLGFALTVFVCLQQIIYWNMPWKRILKRVSTTTSTEN